MEKNLVIFFPSSSFPPPLLPLLLQCTRILSTTNCATSSVCENDRKTKTGNRVRKIEFPQKTEKEINAFYFCASGVLCCCFLLLRVCCCIRCKDSCCPRAT